jgi:DNA-binding HxlR family transcriptional regulator
MFKSKRSYGEFLQTNEKISTNILADRLQKLEAAGIAIKEIDKQNKSKFIYALTDKGKDLLPIMLQLEVVNMMLLQIPPTVLLNLLKRINSLYHHKY